MYEKHGLMVKLTNPLCINYVRRKEEPNSSVVERALLYKLGLNERAKKNVRTRRKNTRNTNGFPVKIMDQRLIAHIVEQRKRGVVQRYTVECAILDAIKAETETQEV